MMSHQNFKQTGRTSAAQTNSDPIRSGHYDGETTTEYQLRQLPPESGIHPGTWKEAFSPFQIPVPSFEQRRAEGRIGDSDRGMLVWKYDERATRHGASVQYREFGYDSLGFVCLLGRPARSGSVSEIQEAAVKDGHAQPDLSVPWAGQRLGREWIFGLNGSQDDSLFSLAAAQFYCIGDDPLDRSRRAIARRFLVRFRAKWDADFSRPRFGISGHIWTRSASFNRSNWDDLAFQYHIRVFTTNPKGKQSGPGLERSSGKLHIGAEKERARGVAVVELRYSVGLKTTTTLDYPVFTLVTMADSSLIRLGDLALLSDSGKWRLAGVHPFVRGTGIAAFAFRIQSLFPQWEEHWFKLIDDVGKALTSNADLDTILSPTLRRRIMIDGSDLQLSEFYFSVIQTLRVAADWIQESMDDLRLTVDEMERLYFGSAPSHDRNVDLASRDEAIAAFKQNWDNVIACQQRIGIALLDRISKKQEEAKSLRDGLFNATSVNETTKSTQLNHYILVFTVVTIFYLPLSFITFKALFALGFFDLKDGPSHARSFVVSIISVACATYLFSWLMIWVVRDPGRRSAPGRAFDALANLPAELRRRRPTRLEEDTEMDMQW